MLPFYEAARITRDASDSDLIIAAQSAAESQWLLEALAHFQIIDRVTLEDEDGPWPAARLRCEPPEQPVTYLALFVDRQQDGHTPRWCLSDIGQHAALARATALDVSHPPSRLGR